MQTRQKIRKMAILASLLLFPVTLYYFSPHLIIMGSSQGIITGSFIVFALLFLSSLFIGRFFCGWLCPGAGLQEALIPVKDKRISQKYDWVKFLIWVPWISIIAFSAFQAGGYKSTDFFYQTASGISVAEPAAYLMYFSVVGLFVALSLAIGKRSVCHHVCWMAPFMIIGRKISNALRLPSLRLTADRKKCTSCLTCTNGCPMSLDVNQMVQKENLENRECVLCGTCVDGCPKGAIQYNI